MLSVTVNVDAEKTHRQNIVAVQLMFCVLIEKLSFSEYIQKIDFGKFIIVRDASCIHILNMNSRGKPKAINITLDSSVKKHIFFFHFVCLRLLLKNWWIFVKLQKRFDILIEKYFSRIHIEYVLHWRALNSRMRRLRIFAES